MEGFMHKPCTCIRIHKHLHTSLYLFVILACESFHHNTHRPDHIITDMWTSDTFSGFSFEEIRIVFAPYKTTRILIDRIIHIHIAQIRHSYQTGYIRIIHQQLISETIYFKSINCSVFGMIIGCIFLQCTFHFLCKIRTLLSQISSLIYRSQYLCSFSK